MYLLKWLIEFHSFIHPGVRRGLSVCHPFTLNHLKPKQWWRETHLGVWKTHTMKWSHMLTYSNPLIEGRSVLVLWGEERISQRTETRYTAKLRSKERRVNSINMSNSIHAKESHIKLWSVSISCSLLIVSNTDVTKLWGWKFCHISCFVNISQIYTQIPAQIFWYSGLSSMRKDQKDALNNGCIKQIFYIERLRCQNVPLALCKRISSAQSLCHWIRNKKPRTQGYTARRSQYTWSILLLH